MECKPDKKWCERGRKYRTLIKKSTADAVHSKRKHIKCKISNFFSPFLQLDGKERNVCCCFLPLPIRFRLNDNFRLKLLNNVTILIEHLRFGVMLRKKHVAINLQRVTAGILVLCHFISWIISLLACDSPVPLFYWQPSHSVA